jgi:hypothetical protein
MKVRSGVSDDAPVGAGGDGGSVPRRRAGSGSSRKRMMAGAKLHRFDRGGQIR